jgi:pSer/pThr/pTyr-binding forkhead associated (FHA) protein
MAERNHELAVARVEALTPEQIPVATVQLANDVSTIGRSSNCDIIVQHPLVSRLHARIERSGPRYILADAGSANGTYINGRRLIQPQVLLHDDVIALGNTQPALRFT